MAKRRQTQSTPAPAAAISNETVTAESTQGSTARASRFPLVIIIALYVLFAVGYNAVTPAGTADQHNPDENGHVEYIQVLSRGHLPVFHGSTYGPEYHQPPLYYLLCTPVYLMCGGQRYPGPGGLMTADGFAIHAVRFVSTLIGIVLILAAYRCVRLLFPDEPFLALFVAALVGLIPMNVAMNASVGNDCLTNAFVAVGLAIMSGIAVDTHHDRLIKRAMPLGVILGLTIFTKSSALVLFPAVLLAWLVLAYRNQTLSQFSKGSAGAGSSLRPLSKGSAGVGSILTAAATSLCLGLLIGSPWLIRNNLLYGDPLGQKLFMRSFSNTAQAAPFIEQMKLPAYLGLVEKWTFASFWGVFDQMRAFWGSDPTGPTPSLLDPLALPYVVLGLLCVAAIIGLGLYVRSHKFDAAQSCMMASMAALVLGTWYGFTMFILTFFQAQGRYWYTSLVPLAIFFALGWRGLLPQPTAYRVGVLIAVVGLAVLNGYTIFGFLLPRFSP